MHRFLNKSVLHLSYLAVFMLVLVSSCREETFSPAQADSFIKFYGNYYKNEGSDVKSLDDGGYVIAGNTSVNNSDSDIIVILTDKYGNEIGTPKNYGGAYNDHASSLKVLSDGGFAIIGSTETEAHDRAIISNMYLIRTDSAGDTLWTKNYGGYSNDVGYHLSETSDGGFILIGYTEDIASGSTDILIVKTDPDGEMIWSRTHGGSGDDVGTYITETDDGYIYTGYTNSYSKPGQSMSNIFIAKTNTNGRLTFPITYGSMGDDSGKSIISVPEGGYVVLGTTTNTSTNTRNIYLSRIEDDISKPLWTKSFGDEVNHDAVCIKRTTEGNFIITGTQELSQADHVIFLLKTDSQGNPLFFKTFGGSGHQRGGAVDLSHDGGYIITGSNKVGANSMITLIKTKGDGEL
ncbi:MAG: hypothetical protein R6U58_13425 [Bacteroidales bacterium]